ncbi:MAG: SDR family oxidoreductase [Caulobacterales bacterium]|nr:SDR family oxidoreductase [Caulobacterales bacterium]
MAHRFDDLFSIRGKTALVTGGSRGIGEMIAAGFLAHGAKVYISSRKADVCEAAAARLAETYGGVCQSLPADLSTLAGVEHVAGEIAAREDRLDILVNNAGAAWGAPLEAFPEKGWDKVMDTNVKGVFFLTQKLMPLLHAAASPETPAKVVNIGSIDGLKTAIFETYSYIASKAALHHLTRFFAAHQARNHVIFNAIAPGGFPTYMLSTGIGEGGKVDGVDWSELERRNPSGRLGAPEDIVGLSLFLCSRAGDYVVGQTIALDGGVIAAG